MMFQQRIAEDHATLPPEVEASINETPVLIQEEEQDTTEDDDDAEKPAVVQASGPTQWVTATTGSGWTS